MNRIFNRSWSALGAAPLIVLAVSTSAQPRVAKETIPKDAPSNIRELLEACYSPGALARGKAAKGLGDLKSDARVAVPFLMSMLEDKESYMDSFQAGTLTIHGFSTPGRQAAVALGNVGGPAVAPLLALLGSPRADRDLAVVALGITRDPSAVMPLVKALTDKTAAVRAEAASALGAMKDRRAVEPLIEALSDPEPNVQSNAESALQQVTGQKLGKVPAPWREWWKANKGS